MDGTIMECTTFYGDKGRRMTKVWTEEHWTDYEKGIIAAERERIAQLLREQAEFWKEWEYPEEYIFAVDVLLERIKCKPTSKSEV